MSENKDTNKEQQTITYDDFEQSLIKDGIEIIEMPEEADKPEGIGAVGNNIRTTAPSTTNPYYIKDTLGGYNPCILISGNSCLPNCVGYCHGAMLEEAGITKDNRFPRCNAEDWYAVAKNNGLEVGQKAKLGATIVWKSGNFWNGADGCGHVGIVTDISGDTITVAQSNYGGTRWFMTKHKKPYSIYGQTFVGFVYNPYVLDYGWKKNNKGWWYQRADGTYPKNEWEKIKGKWYHFDSKGYMQTGWIHLKNKWYFLKSSGAMATGWIKDENKWYYLLDDGAMVTGKRTNITATFNSSGVLQEG